MTKIHRKQTTKAGTDGKRIKIESRKWYGTIRLPDGRYRQIPLSEDYRASLGLLRRAQTEADQLRALGLTDQSKRRSEPLTAHIAEYRAYLESKGDSSEHVAKTVGRIERVIRALKATRIQDLNSGKVSNLLARWRTSGAPETRPGRKPAPLSHESSNHYTRSLRAFSRWLWSSEVVESDILRGLRPLNVKVDRRHVRRALSDTEISRLIRMTRSHGKTIHGWGWSLSGVDRSMLYSIACHTGLRAGELRSLTPETVDLESCVIRLEARNTKNKTDAVLPIHPSLIESLREWLKNRPAGEPLWGGRWHTMGASMIRRDLRLCGGSYRDEDGRVFDFHSLRGQFITTLARAGIHPATAQRLARHSSIELTMNHYTHVATEELRASLGTVPAIGIDLDPTQEHVTCGPNP